MDLTINKLVQDALIWAERGRARALMYQLGRGTLSPQAREDLLLKV